MLDRALDRTLDSIANACPRWVGGITARRQSWSSGVKSARRAAARALVTALGATLLMTVSAHAQAGAGQPPVPVPARPAVPSGAPAPTQSPLFNSPSNAKARQIVQEAVTAMGGAAFLGEKYRSGHGRIYTFDSMGGLASPGTVFWNFNRFPDAERVELTKKRDVVYIYNGDKGWEVTFRGPQPLPAQALRRFRESRDHSMDVVLRRWAQNPQTLMIYRGVNMVDQQQVDSVDFSNTNGETVTIDFDLNSHLPMRVHWRQDDPQTGGYYEKSITYGNYQMIDGINTPLIVQNFEGSQRVQQVYYEGMSYAPVSDNLFEPPAKKK